MYEPTFLYAPGEPADVSDTDRPRSVWAGIHALQDQRPAMWREMAAELFDLRGPRDAALLMAEGVMAKITDLGSVDMSANPAKVYIDKRKRFYVEVYS